jgi:hypothetical protein
MTTMMMPRRRFAAAIASLALLRAIPAAHAYPGYGREPTDKEKDDPSIHDLREERRKRRIAKRDRSVRRAEERAAEAKAKADEAEQLRKEAEAAVEDAKLSTDKEQRRLNVEDAQKRAAEAEAAAKDAEEAERSVAHLRDKTQKATPEQMELLEKAATSARDDAQRARAAADSARASMAGLPS